MATIIIGGMAMSGCEGSDAFNNKQTVTTRELSEPQVEEKSTGSKEKKAVLDSINIVNNRVDELLTKIETQKSVIEKNQSNIDDIKKTLSISILVSWTLAVISMILSIYALIKVKSINARAGRHREEIDELTQSLMDMRCNLVSSARNKNTGASTLLNRDYTGLLCRISELERLYKQKQAHITSAVGFGRGEKSMIPQTHTQHGYFGLPSQMSMTEAYFKKFDEIRDSDSRFTVEIKDEKAVFKPLLESTRLLNGIKSGDVIKFALEFHGCALSDATQMEVISAGEAIKKDGLWIITRKARISLAK